MIVYCVTDEGVETGRKKKWKYTELAGNDLAGVVKAIRSGNKHALAELTGEHV
jgi:hypothetical protein